MVSSLTTSCQCTATGDKEFTIPPGGRHRVALKMNLLRKNDEDATASSRPFAVNIIAQTSVPGERPFVWLLQGEVRSAIDLSPTRIDLGDALVGGPATETREARFESLIPLRDLTASCPDAALRIQVMSIPPDPPGTSGEPSTTGHEYVVKASVIGATSLGPQVSKIILKPVTATGETLPPAEFEVRYRGVGEIGYRPEFPLLGAAPVGTQYREELQIYSRDKHFFRVTTLRGNPVDVFEPHCVTMSSPAFHHSVSVLVQPRSGGLHSGTVEVDWEIVDPLPGTQDVHGTLRIPLTVLGSSPTGISSDKPATP